MVSFDMRTIIFSFLLTYFVCIGIIFLFWIQNQKRYKGTARLLAGYMLQASGILLIFLRGVLPDWATVVTANTLLVAGLVSIYEGLESFFEVKPVRSFNYFLIIIFATVHAWFTFHDPDLNARSINLNVASLIIFAQSTWLMFKRVPRKSSELTNPAGITFIAFMIVCVLRILFHVLKSEKAPENFFDSGTFETMITVIYHMLLILLTYSLFLMYVRRLLFDIKYQEQISAIARQEQELEKENYNKLISHERNLLRSLIDHLPDPVSVKDKEGRFLLLNDSCVRLLGAENQKAAIGRSAADFMSHEEVEKTDKHDLNVMWSGKVLLDMVETRAGITEGFYKTYLTSRIPIMNQSGFVDKLITVSHDITERKRAEDALRESAEFNRTLLRTIPFGMDIVDQEGNILFLNDVLLNQSGTETIGKKCWEVFCEDNTQCSSCPRKDIVPGKTGKFEAVNMRGGRVYEIYYTGLTYYGKQALLEIFLDITVRKHSEEDLIVSKIKAEESDRLKTAFLHNISHEIRTPMHAILGFTSLLGKPEVTPGNHSAYLEIINQNSNQLLSIVTDIIEISNIEAGKLRINRSHFDLSQVLDNLLSQFNQTASGKGLEFSFEKPENSSDAFINTDRTKFIQIITNLLTNAFKFTEEGYVRFGYEKNNNQYCFFVSDSGIGISEQQQIRIFERFYQVDSREDRKYEGIGLGLSLSKAYVEILGGTISVFSKLGKGSTFFVNLPAGD